jgi:hypothetical protein
VGLALAVAVKVDKSSVRLAVGVSARVSVGAGDSVGMRVAVSLGEGIAVNDAVSVGVSVKVAVARGVSVRVGNSVSVGIGGASWGQVGLQLCPALSKQAQLSMPIPSKRPSIQRLDEDATASFTSFWKELCIMSYEYNALAVFVN